MTTSAIVIGDFAVITDVVESATSLNMKMVSIPEGKPDSKVLE